MSNFKIEVMGKLDEIQKSWLGRHYLFIYLFNDIYAFHGGRDGIQGCTHAREAFYRSATSPTLMCICDLCVCMCDFF
jgi:hypothetical protein